MVGDARWLASARGVAVEHRRRRSTPIKALAGVDLDVQPGDAIALLGPNGSGKSTLLRTLAGLRRPTAGRVTLRDGVRLGVVFQHPALDTLLTVRENLRLQAALFGIASPAESIEQLCARQAIDERLDDRVGTLSGGLVRRVEFARAILAEPDLLLLDEPTVGLDLPARAALLGALEDLRAERPDLAVVMSTHLMSDAERFDRVVMMSAGAIARQGSPAELVASLGELLIAVPAGADVGDEARWQARADGSRVARPADAAELARWSARLVEAGVPFSVRPPTLADAYLHFAGTTLDAAVVA